MIVPIPRLYLGTMTFGWSQTSSVVDEEVAKTMVSKFIEFNKKRSSTTGNYIDTARIYAGGATEPIVGESIASHDLDQIRLGTKAHPSQINGLSPKGIQEQFDASIKAMNVNSVWEYFLHQPDTENTLLGSLTHIDGLIKCEKVKSLGMSNYHVSEIKRAFELCDENGLEKPKVYQGLYNPLNRQVEKELIPLLKENDCSFVAYNPLAAGLLTGKHTPNTSIMDGRFKKNPNYLPRFFTEENFRALGIIKDACDSHGICLIEASFRWLLRHSALTENDGVLLGASSIKQLDENLDACIAGIEKDPLPESILQAFDQAWMITEKTSFPYWRSYSSDMPERELLDQGASYSAAKK